MDFFRFFRVFRVFNLQFLKGRPRDLFTASFGQGGSYFSILKAK